MVAITSEQLFQVVQAGYKPVFIGDYSSAEMLYNIACDVLREIINDNMSDMQKVIAIYEWVCYNNVYDHNLSDRTTEIYSLMTNATDEEKTIYEQIGSQEQLTWMTSGFISFKIRINSCLALTKD